MKILIDILHPAHVHFFRNFYFQMQEEGHQFVVTARDKECTLELLRQYDIPHKVLSKQASGALGLGIELISRTLKMIRLILREKPDCLTGIMGPSIAIAGKVCHRPSIVFYDTEIAKRTNAFVYPLAHRVVTPDCYLAKVKGHHVRLSSYQELAYLHPDVFEPEKMVLDEFGINRDEPFVVLRFVSWQASHDIGHSGVSLKDKIKLVQHISQYARVLISSESTLPYELSSYRLIGPSEKVHHLLAFARLLVGDSGTMTTEAACLGTLGVVFMPVELGNFKDLEDRFGLISRFRPDQMEQALARIDELMKSEPKLIGKQKQEELLKNKLNMTAWMKRFFVHGFPLKRQDPERPDRREQE